MKEYQKRYINGVKEEVEFNIEGENKANNILNNITPKILNVFTTLEEGEQILKKGYSVSYGEMLLKYKKQVDKILKDFETNFKSEEITPSIYLSCSTYSVYINIKIIFNNKSDGFIYYEKQKYILNLKEGCLRNLYEFTPYEELNLSNELKILEECFKLHEELEKKKEQFKHFKSKALIK